MRGWLVAFLLLFVPSVVADDAEPPATEATPAEPSGDEPAAEGSPEATVGQDESGRPSPVWYSEDPETGSSGIAYGGKPDDGIPPTWSGGGFIPIGVDCPVGAICPW